MLAGMVRIMSKEKPYETKSTARVIAASGPTESTGSNLAGHTVKIQANASNFRSF